MKLNSSKKLRKCIIPLVLVLLLALNILSRFPAFETTVNEITASAASLTTTTIKSRFDEKMNSLSTNGGWVESSGMLVTGVNSDMWQATSGLSTSWIDADTYGIKAENKAASAVGWRITPAEGFSVWDYVYTSDAAVSNYVYSGSDTSSPAIPTNTEDANLYYTIELDNVLGYYRQYYVSTADQLATLLYHYQSDFATTLKVKASEKTGTLANKLGVVLLNDIDLGGSDSQYWKGYYSGSVRLEIDGQGHTIYNGWFATGTDYFIGNYAATNYNYYPRYFAVHDVTFSNMYLARAGGIFGAARYAYFNNVNWEHCLAASGGTLVGSNSIVFASSYLYVYLNDCTIDDCYVAGYGHCGLFASFNGSRSYYENTSYIGDTTLSQYMGETDIRNSNTEKTNQGFYYTSVPDNVEDAERAWGGYSKTWSDGNTYWLQINYPSIYENCATVNSAVYDAGANHSGTFISCMQGGLIFKNCFSNSIIYANTQLGVFVGAVIGCGDGFYYPYNGAKTYVNSYFEDCYTSGSIEGNSYLGGFVGVIFDDGRITGSSTTTFAVNRGKAVFKNCYSTSAVGMQYAGTAVGGFAGVVVGNIKANNSDDICHICENCYAAGEVGGILSKTSTDGTENTETIGGFIGVYVNFSEEAKTAPVLTSTDKDGNVLVKTGTLTSAIEGEFYKNYAVPIDQLGTNNTVTLINCFYDKQTTAMRERDIGNASNNFYNVKYLTHSLSGTLPGLTGVYTKTSDKGVEGLADTSGIMLSSAWQYMMNYYPQLTDFFNYQYPENYYSLSSEAQKMHDKRAELYRNYALASTATVLLDHYEQYLNTSGELVDASPLVYDTVRDITRKFEFTTDGENEIVWSNNQERNAENNYINTIDGAGKGFSISYDTVIETTDASGNRTTVPSTSSIVHNPAVMKIVYDDTDPNNTTYKCSEFAPGRQWVKVTAGSNAQMGLRELRLLPTAYLSAGGTLDVNVIPDETDTTKVLRNDVTINNGSTNDTLPKFNHYAGVAYALSDKNRMSTANGSTQTVKAFSASDKSSFALYSGYLLTGNSTAVGLNDSGQMYAQKFAVTGQENDSSDGMTMVKVFTTKIVYLSENQYILEQDEEITDTNQLKKWSGQELFTTSDVGYYYMVYYWRLNDGRYLTDNKLVKIKSESHTVEIVTGIINEEHTMIEAKENDDFRTAIDQYVTDDITTEDVYDDGNLITKDVWPQDLYPSKKATFNPEVDYNDYNLKKIYNGDTYYTKSSIITSTKEHSVVGWHRTTDYRLTTLIVEVQVPDGSWVEMTRIVGDNVSTLDFSNAEYSYAFSGYTVKQDPETKLFTVTEIDSSVQNFFVENSSTRNGIENYIEFNFDSMDDVENLTYDVSSSLRVTALFRRNYADVHTEKFVLKLLDSDTSQTADSESTESLQEQDEAYEVDNTNITNNDNRKAVLSGDILTYRMKLHNAGYFDSDVVNVYDVVPDNCTYVDGSAVIYRQHKDIASGTAKYDKVTEIDLMSETDYIAEYNLSDNRLHWQIPSVELDYDYYVQYQVTVDQLEASEVSRLLTNTAQFDYVMLNGDLISNNNVPNADTSISSFKENAVFDMNMEVSDNTNSLATYEITFNQNEAETGVVYQNIYFKGELPDGFEFVSDTITLVSVDENGDETIIADEDDTYEYTDDDGNLQTSKKIVKDGHILTIKGVHFDSDTTYLVRFTGSSPELKSADEELVYKASILYDRVEDDLTSQAMGNAITWTAGMTNQVETDVTHLYLNVEKTIACNDPSQTFLFKIERFENQDETDAASETFYTQVQCTKQDDGTYQGSQLVQVDKRGYYVVTEVTDWSATDYNFKSATGTDVTIATAAKQGNMTQSGDSVSLTLPRRMYVSGAFPTSMGTLAGETYPTVKFTNTESVYAYRSGQAYAENQIVSKAG